MSVDEARRLALHEAAASNDWNAEAALTLMELLPPSGWGDVVRRSDLDGLELRMRLELERAVNRVLLWTVGTMIAMAGVFGAISRLD